MDRLLLPSPVRPRVVGVSSSSRAAAAAFFVAAAALALALLAADDLTLFPLTDTDDCCWAEGGGEPERLSSDEDEAEDEGEKEEEAMAFVGRPYCELPPLTLLGKGIG